MARMEKIETDLTKNLKNLGKSFPVAESRDVGSSNIKTNLLIEW